MKFKYIVGVTLFLLLFSACQNTTDKTLDTTLKEQASGHFRASHAHTLYHQKLDDMILEKIALKIKNSTDTIDEKIMHEASLVEHHLKSGTLERIKKAIIKLYSNAINKYFMTVFGSDIATQYQIFLDNINIHNSDYAQKNLTASEHEELKQVVDLFFQNQSTQIEQFYHTTLEAVSHNYFHPSSVELNDNMRSDDSSSSQRFDDAEDNEKFEDKMTHVFPSFNSQKDHNDSKEYDKAPAGDFIYEKIPVTNTFDGTILRIHKPNYDNGFEVESPECKVDFNKIDTFNPDEDPSQFFAVAADLEGDGTHSLLVFKRYKGINSTYRYFPFLLTRDYCNNKILPKVAGFDEAINLHISDIAAGNIDDDSGVEFLIAIHGNSNNSGNKIILFDDINNGYTHITNFKFSNSSLEDAVVRIAMGDANADGYDEIAAVSYDAKANAWDAQLYAWQPYDSNNSLNIDTAFLSYQFNHKTPVDIVYSDLDTLDKIELFAVQVDPTLTTEHKGYDQPNQSGRADDYCRFFVNSDNYLDVNQFAYDFEAQRYNVATKTIEIRNRTYDKQYDTGYNKDDGVKCNLAHTSCSCDETFKAIPYHLYTPFGDNGLWKPIYITSYHESQDAPSVLDIDGFEYRYGEASSNDVISPASLHSVTVEHKGAHYTPVHSTCKNCDPDVNDRCDQCTNAHEFTTTMTRGQRKYAQSHYTRNLPSASNSNTDKKDSVIRYDFDKDENKRLSTFPYETVVLEFEYHDILFSDPKIDYIIAAPPSIAGGSSFTLEFATCDEHTRTSKYYHGAVFGISATAGAEVGNNEITASVNFKTVQSSASIKGHKTSHCVTKSDKIYSGNDSIVKFRANLVDIYVYKIIKDLDGSNGNDIGKTITISTTRKATDKGYKQYNQVWSLPDFQEMQQEYNISLDFDANLSQLITSNNGPVNQEGFYNILKDPQENISDEFNYLYFWYPDTNLQIPQAVETSGLKFTEGYLKKIGDYEKDDYTLTGTAAIKFKDGLILGGSLTAGRSWGYLYEDTYANSEKTAYGLSVTGNKESYDQSIGIFTYYALPAEDTQDCKIPDEIPVDRLEAYNPHKNYACSQAIMVIDFFTSDDPNNKSSDDLD